MINGRFDELLGRLLDENELASEEWRELLEFLRESPALLTELRDQMKVSELIAICEDPVRGSSLFLEATSSRLFEDRFVSGVRVAMERSPVQFRRIQFRSWRSALTAAAAAMVVTAIALWPHTSPEVAKVTGLNGSFQWIGDGGHLQRELKVGSSLRGGTLEALSADSWMSIEFRDGSLATVSGPAMLTLAEDNQKHLNLREGGLFAKISPQARGRPMLINTRTAALEVLGTQLDVQAERESTRLNVEEGVVRVTRLVDGSTAEVRARHQVVASADQSAALIPKLRAEPIDHWKSRLTASIGKPLAAEGDLPARLKSMPIILSRPAQGTFAVFVAAFTVAQADSPPVLLTPNSTFRIRGRIDNAYSDLGFGVTMKRAGGSFGGKFEAIVPFTGLMREDGSFDLTLDPAILEPLQPGTLNTALNSEVEDCYVFTVGVDAGLEVLDVELLPSSPSNPLPIATNRR